MTNDEANIEETQEGYKFFFSIVFITFADILF